MCKGEISGSYIAKGALICVTFGCVFSDHSKLRTNQKVRTSGTVSPWNYPPPKIPWWDTGPGGGCVCKDRGISICLKVRVVLITTMLHWLLLWR